MLTLDEIVEGEVETIAFGGDGIMRYHGFVIFVPFTAIGDRIICRITEIKRSFAKGKLVSLKYASKQRAIPPCPYFGTCGGCQLQHLNHEAQMKYKINSVNETLKHIGHLSFPPFSMIPATLNWAYRRHITLHLRPKKGGFEAGYISFDNQSLVVVKGCPIFIELTHPILDYLQNFLQLLENPFNESGKVLILKNHRNQFIFAFQFGNKFKIKLSIFQNALQKNPLIAGIMIQSHNNQTISLGDIYCEEKLEGLIFRFSPQTFVQNHPEQSSKIYKQISQLAGSSLQHQILDLYCGFGMTSLLLAKEGHSVTGIEYNGHAISFAKENGNFNHIKNAQFIEGDVAKILPHWLKTHKPSLIIVNPPRQGLSKKVAETLRDSEVNSLLYISCLPATLARDLKILSNHYRIKEGHVYDMFPQTAHVETLVRLTHK